MMRRSSSSRRNCSYMDKVESCSGNGRGQKLDSMCNGGGRSIGRASDDAELLSTWPPRHYTCNFCKRRFKSVQALGGHMNVHRRARALLRSQYIPPISSQSSWHPTNISTAHHPQQNDETHFFTDFTNPDLNCSLLNPPHLIRNHSFPYLPRISITSPSTLRHVNLLSAAASGYTHAPGSGQYQPFNGAILAKKNNCITAEDKINYGILSSRNTHQDDPLVSLSLGNSLIISNSTDQLGIDLELRL